MTIILSGMVFIFWFIFFGTKQQAGNPVQKIIRDQDRWAAGHGCRAACYYTGTGALNRLLLYRLAEPDSEHYRFRVYPHRAKAVEALESAGFSITDKQLNSFFRGEGERV